MNNYNLDAQYDPFQLFNDWFSDACGDEAIKEPTAMNLATVFENVPSNRMVLLKEHDKSGFVFYTNMESRKSRELQATGNAALCFYWPAHDRQIRITGKAEQVPPAQADAYFVSRTREKQIGAWASQQSRQMASRTALDERITAYTEQFKEADSIPRPPFWSGWKIVPETMEFWQQKPHRLHERCRFVLNSGDQSWEKQWLYP